jgi:asparagine synthase (glutamine-hydrolysing)
MGVKVINDAKYQWEYFENQGSQIYFKGHLEYQNYWYQKSDACHKLLEIFSSPSNPQVLKDFLPKINGTFAFILVTPKIVLAAVDRKRSYPIFYHFTPNDTVFSNSARRLAQECGLQEKNPDAQSEFEMAGYVTDNETLLKGLFQLQAGECWLFDPERKFSGRERYYRFWPNTLNTPSDDQLIEELHNVSLSVFSDLAKSFQGRPVWVPLSGGLDSRWILAMLRHLKYDNIMTFSYGKKGHPEIARAKIIAEKLKVQWQPVYYRREKTREIFYSSEGRQYSDFADGLCSIPVYNDFYAIQLLRKDNRIPNNAIFVNGQTGDFLTGGHIPKNVVKNNVHSRDFLIREIIDKHLSLWVNLKTTENLTKISQRIIGQLGLEDRQYSQQEVAQYFEQWEWQERQSKFVVNGQRVYEWFGYDWRLPLWDDRLMHFWEKIPWEKRFGQKLHKAYLNKMNFGGVFNGFYMGPHPLQRWERLATYALIVGAKLSGQSPDRLVKTYLGYFTNYAPFYLQKSYPEYLRDAYWHRNPFSYLVKEYIENNRANP